MTILIKPTLTSVRVGFPVSVGSQMAVVPERKNAEEESRKQNFLMDFQTMRQLRGFMPPGYQGEIPAG